VTVTERYAHLRADLFRPEDLLKLSVGMSREGGTVVDLAAARAEQLGQGMTTVPAGESEAGG
jgi:hypothetical protein